jgi:lipopolysaccharide/colanic/teichoic acid biosynthesis glycosyltransferase
VIDIGLSGLALVLVSPVLAVVAILVRRLVGKPAIFRQERPGFEGKPFMICKFRTMSNAEDAAGQLLPDEDRLNPFGSLLRSTSVDELPELWNVVKGDMSLVGPRPLMPYYTPYLTSEESLRFTVRPGLTGWAQINGRNTIPWDERLAYDVWYVHNRTTELDLRILLRTVVTVLRREGVVVDPSLAMPSLDDERRQDKVE